MENTQILANALAQCHGRQAPFLADLPVFAPPLDMAKAYLVQSQMVAELGLTVAGWKLASATKEAQASNGLFEPTVGRLLEGAVIADPATVALNALNKPMVEVEIAVTLGREILPAQPLTDRNQAHAALATVQLAIELADTRYVDQAGKTQPEIVADNCGAAYLVLGEQVALAELEAVCQAPLTLSFADGSVVPGFEPQKRPDPLDALLFLSAFAAREGQVLSKGQIITTGTCTPPMPPPPGEMVADFGRFGNVTLSLIG